MDQRVLYEKWRLAGYVTFLAGGCLMCLLGKGDSVPWPLRLLTLPGAILLGVAACLHLRLPKAQKDRLEVSFSAGLFHIYISFGVAAAVTLAALWRLVRGRNRAVDLVIFALLMLFLLAAAAMRIYGRWYYWTDQDKKRKRREYHRKRHGKK